MSNHFLKKPLKITEQSWPENIEPLVSVFNWVYNQKDFIRESIESILNQKTTFPIEIIIHDDASNDGTLEIIKEYESKYPLLFNNILQDENQWSQGKSVMNSFLVKPQGKFIALTHGDDYWIDYLKLQKQVDFLEANPDYGLIHTNYHFYYNNDKTWLYNATSALNRNASYTTKEELFQAILDVRYQIRTATVLLRCDLLKRIPKNTVDFPMGDTPLWLDLLQLSKFKYLDEPTTVYRILSNSASRATNIKNQLRFNLSILEMRIYYCQKYKYSISPQLKKKYDNRVLHYLLYEPDYTIKFPLFQPSFHQKLRFQNKAYRQLIHKAFINVKAIYRKINKVRKEI